MSDSTAGLCFVGAVYLDTILAVPWYPQEDAKLRARAISKRRGGNGPNAAEAVSHLCSDSDLSLHLISVLPAQDAIDAQTIKNSLPRVDCSRCIHRSGQAEAASSYILQTPTSRTIVNHNPLPEMTLEEFKHSAAATKAACYHFEGRMPQVTMACIQHLQASDPPPLVSVEIEMPDRHGLPLLIPVANVLFFSKSWAQANHYTSAAECVEGQAKEAKNAFLLCCTWGEEGAAAIQLPGRPGRFNLAPGSPTQSYKASLPYPVIDVVGAGDTFTGAMLAQLLTRPAVPLFDRLKAATMAASLKVTQDGFAGLHW